MWQYNDEIMKAITVPSTELKSSPIVSSGALIFMPFIHPPQAKRTAETLARRAGAEGTIVSIFDLKREGFVALVNRAFRSSDSPFVGYLAEDAFAGRDWLKIALDALNIQKARLLGFNDGKWQGNLAAFGLVERAWAHKNYGGDLFHPGYQQHYADTELTLLAKSDKAYAYNPNSVVVEVDWDKDQKPTNAKDKTLFQERAKSGFDGRVSDPQLLEMFS
jgi:hypothetical protein